jgi:hypothetical protein
MAAISLLFSVIAVRDVHKFKAREVNDVAVINVTVGQPISWHLEDGTVVVLGPASLGAANLFGLSDEERQAAVAGFRMNKDAGTYDLWVDGIRIWRAKDARHTFVRMWIFAAAVLVMAAVAEGVRRVRLRAQRLHIAQPNGPPAQTNGHT